VSDLRLVQTSEACPEQYDVLDATGAQVGYLRLRHGAFRVEHPDCGGELLATFYPEGDGAFQPEERERFLALARFVVSERLARPSVKDEDEEEVPA
jgi:hypothetical protein